MAQFCSKITSYTAQMGRRGDLKFCGKTFGIDRTRVKSKKNILQHWKKCGVERVKIHVETKFQQSEIKNVTNNITFLYCETHRSKGGTPRD